MTIQIHSSITIDDLCTISLNHKKNTQNAI